MSRYEEAPSTALVAMACCVCGRPLIEAESIKSGIGPICAEKTGYGREDVPGEVREEVNRLVYELAAFQKDPRAVPHLARLRALGFGAVAERIEERLAGLVEIELTLRGLPEAQRLALVLPRLDDATFASMVIDLRSVPGRKVEKFEGMKTRCTTIPNATASILALYRVLARHLPGRVARSPKGLFVVPTEAELGAILEKPRSPRAGEGVAHA